MAHAFPRAPIHTSLLDYDGTFPEFRDLDLRTFPINRVGLLRHHHKVALPVLAGSFSHHVVDADVVLCSSSGWAHGAATKGRKIVYCHTPARWLYQEAEYLRGRSHAFHAAFRPLHDRLLDWDLRMAGTAHRYLANSTVVADRIREAYGIDAEVLHPPFALAPDGLETPVAEVGTGGHVLLVARLCPYKNVDRVVRAFDFLPEHRLVVVGRGPQEGALRESAPANVTILGAADDRQLRWLYRTSSMVVAASWEDFGLTPLEAAAFGKPVAVLRWGGFLDSVVEGRTGVFFDHPDPVPIARAVDEVSRTDFDREAIVRHSERFSEAAFTRRLQQIVGEEAVA